MSFQRTVPFAGSRPFSLTEPQADWLDTLAPAMQSPASAFSSTLGSSLLSDLKRFVDDPDGAELLAVVAAGVRHARALRLQLELHRLRIHLSLLPRDQVHRCSVDLCTLPSHDLGCLRLVHVEPDALPGRDAGALHGRPLGPLLWALAMHGPRDELLPEIAGRVKYRLAPGTDVQQLDVGDDVQALLHRLWCESSSLEELTDATAVAPARVRRLLNALYLQSGLMISRAFSSRSRAPVLGA